MADKKNYQSPKATDGTATKEPEKQDEKLKKGGRTVTEKERIQQNHEGELETPNPGRSGIQDHEKGSRSGNRGPGSSRGSDGNQLDDEEQHIRRGNRGQ